MNDTTQQGSCCNCGIFTYMGALLLPVDRPISFDQKLIIGQECRNWIGFSILIEILGNIFNMNIVYDKVQPKTPPFSTQDRI